MDTKSFKRQLNHSKNYHRRGFGHQEEAAQTMDGEYKSELIQRIRDNNYLLSQGQVTIHLAESFGFCWGVERAVAMAYETRQHFPTEKIWMTNEIIHNPSVNQRLKEMNVEFIEVQDGIKDFSGIDQGDVVILPAFGATVQEMKLLQDRETTIVDTTCPWVSKVWNSVEKHKKRDYTSIIHGKYNHEETVATSSFADKYLVVLNMEQAHFVADYILQDGDREEFFAYFHPQAYSQGFDPDQDLIRVGVANQTTMLKTETEAIGKLFETTMLKKYGPIAFKDHFMSFNTICDATQERQDAMVNLVQEPLDLMLVIGGFNSSNTTHLQEMAIDRGLHSFHIDCIDRLKSPQEIEHKPLGQDITVAQNWLPEGNIHVGITSGASTPDRVVEEIINQVLAYKS